MKIGCICGNVLRDQTDYIPFKAWYVADQDLEDFAAHVGRTIEERSQEEAPADLVYAALVKNARTLYQCRNCGRILADDPDGDAALQVFRPECEGWKEVLASSAMQESKPCARNLVGHWDSELGKGELWFDPAPKEKGGYEQFDDRGQLEARYYELFASMRSTGNLVGSRLGIGGKGQSIEDIHSWKRQKI